VTARTLGVSVKRLLGWEPETRTVHHYLPDGRLRESVTVRESEWDDEQRGLMLALDVVEHDACDGCGQPLSETMAPDAFESYVAEAAGRCHACDAIGIASESRKSTPRPQLMRWRIHKREDRS